MNQQAFALARMRSILPFSFSNPDPAKRSGFEKEKPVRRNKLCRLRRSAAVSQVSTRGRNGFDGGTEAGSAGGCARHPKNGQL